VGSYTGLIMIVGIISESHFTYLQFKETFISSNDKKAIASLCNINALRPKLMTALGCHYCLMRYSTGSELHQPLAIAVIGGFLIAMPLLLIVLPSLLYYFNIEQKNSLLIRFLCLLFWWKRVHWQYFKLNQ
jgi:Cu/Ag efflux pump CusA